MTAPAAMLDLTGRVVIVTGASGTIGAGIAGRFSAAGALVVAHGHTGGLGSPDGTVRWVRADLTSPGGPGAVLGAALGEFGRVDALVNNAGIQTRSSLADLDDADWAEMIDTNLTSVHRLTRATAAVMEVQGDGGSIVHIASIEGRQPAPFHGHYATAKAALIMHARAAALEYGPAGIRVNTVSPGLIDRPGLADDWPEGVARWQSAVPLGRMGTPEDIGDACVFLCSGLARWITGVDLVVDGGVLTRPTW
ncbi:MAG: SDR family oxidoreductase [Actinobacteria bacterium]|nr:SDR family oxidoreductase [Actinomycetota bacterium]